MKRPHARFSPHASTHRGLFLAALTASLIWTASTGVRAYDDGPIADEFPVEVDLLEQPDDDLDGMDQDLGWDCDTCAKKKKKKPVDFEDDDDGDGWGDGGLDECLTPWTLPGWWWCAPPGTIACGAEDHDDMSSQYPECIDPCVLGIGIDHCIITDDICERPDGSDGIYVWVDGTMTCS